MGRKDRAKTQEFNPLYNIQPGFVEPGQVIEVPKGANVNMIAPANPLLALHDELCGKAKAIMAAKNHDYTSGSGDPFANFRGSEYVGIHPVMGIQLRMQDKMMRVKTFVEKGTLKVKGEGVLDAILDQINYLVLQYGMIKEEQEKSANVG